MTKAHIVAEQLGEIQEDSQFLQAEIERLDGKDIVYLEQVRFCTNG